MTSVDPVEALGYLASILVFLTFCMKTLVPLRIAAISSNLAFLLYGFAADLMPIILLHGFLLPLNIFRTCEQLTNIQKIRRAARGEVSIDLLLGSMTPREMREGDVIFRRGDVADRMYYIFSGQIRLEEFDKTIGTGALLGEVGLFSNEQSRTATAVCVTTGEIHWIERDRILKLCQEHPEFGFALTRLISNRMAENQRQMESRIRELERTVRDMKKERLSA